MQKEDRFLKIHDFLNEFRFFHEKEMMEHYPSGFGEYEAWVDDLMTFDKEELSRFDFYLETKKIKNTRFLNFLNRAKDLLKLKENFETSIELSKNLKIKLTPKKEYEISKIIEIIKDLKFDRQIDIGGGIGHLAMASSKESEREVYSIDMDHKLQTVGASKIERWLPELKDRIKFIPKKIDKSFPLKELTTSETLMTGLHACGPLSTYLIHETVNEKLKYLINFGCCYHKLQDEYNLSSLAQKNPLWFSRHALTIAAKSNNPMNLKDLEDKYQVKKYRYALHFYLIEKKISPFTSIGNTHKNDFQDDFAFFMKKFASDYIQKVTDEELNTFYQDAKIQNMIERTIRAGLIRSIMGRLIEIYLVLDRALFLEEKGYEVTMLALFDPKLSPRNILLFAKRA